MTLLQTVKSALSITNNKRDAELEHNIYAARLALDVGGVRSPVEGDPLLNQAIIYYCRWQFNYQGDGERYRAYFEQLRDTMSYCPEYNGGELT